MGVLSILARSAASTVAERWRFGLRLCVGRRPRDPHAGPGMGHRLAASTANGVETEPVEILASTAVG